MSNTDLKIDDLFELFTPIEEWVRQRHYELKTVSDMPFIMVDSVIEKHEKTLALEYLKSQEALKIILMNFKVFLERYPSVVLAEYFKDTDKETMLKISRSLKSITEFCSEVVVYGGSVIRYLTCLDNDKYSDLKIEVEKYFQNNKLVIDASPTNNLINKTQTNIELESLKPIFDALMLFDFKQITDATTREHFDKMHRAIRKAASARNDHANSCVDWDFW